MYKDALLEELRQVERDVVEGERRLAGVTGCLLEAAERKPG
jgi:hypothetical protein